MLFFTKGPFRPDPHADDAANRGAYLVTALGHCGECHTPRNVLGAMRKSLWLAGTVDGPDDDPVPNITPDAKTGIGDWSVEDIAETLKTGATPLDSKVKGAMKEVVADSTSHLTDADRQAIATYLKAQAPIVNSVTDDARGSSLVPASVGLAREPRKLHLRGRGESFPSSIRAFPRQARPDPLYGRSSIGRNRGPALPDRSSRPLRCLSAEGRPHRRAMAKSSSLGSPRAMRYSIWSPT